MEVTAGIFVKDDHILLMRRAPGHVVAARRSRKVQLVAGNILGEK